MAGRIAYYGGIVTSGLVLALDAAKKDSYPGSGTLWRDISGNGNNGTLTNGPTFNSSNGGSIVFDGVDDYVDCGLTPNLTNIINLTVSVWVYPTQVPSILYPIITRYINPTPVQGWLMYYSPDSRFYFDGRESSAAYLSIGTVSTYSINNWYNVVVTKSANIWSIYINGGLQRTSTLGNGTTPFATNNLIVGGLLLAPNYYNKGRIATSLVYNRGLSATEVLQNYNATKSRYL